MKVVLDKGCREIDAPSGRRYRAKKGVLDMDQADACAVVRYGGAFCSLAGTTARTTGYRCLQCGFGSYFAKCSRCDGEGIKE